MEFGNVCLQSQIASFECPKFVEVLGLKCAKRNNQELLEYFVTQQNQFWQVLHEISCFILDGTTKLSNFVLVTEIAGLTPSVKHLKEAPNIIAALVCRCFPKWLLGLWRRWIMPLWYSTVKRMMALAPVHRAVMTGIVIFDIT